MTPAETVCAVVLTYNRPGALHTCLEHLHAQTRLPDYVLVVDNGSVDDTLEMLARGWPEVGVLALSPNIGAAAGFAAGMAHAYAAGFDWLWIMDDDAYARPDALERLLAQAPAADILVPWQCSERDGLYGASRFTPRGVVAVPAAEFPEPRAVQLFAFIGPLISRRVVGRIGLPYSDYFIDMFDWEYALRAHQAGLRALLVPGSVLDHDAGELKPQRLFGLAPPRPRYWRPTWRMYYDTRNALLTFRRRDLGWPYFAHHLLGQPRAALRELALEHDGPSRVRWRLRANLDGLRGVAGERPGLRAPTAQKPVLGSPQQSRPPIEQAPAVPDSQPPLPG